MSNKKDDGYALDRSSKVVVVKLWGPDLERLYRVVQFLKTFSGRTGSLTRSSAIRWAIMIACESIDRHYQQPEDFPEEVTP